MVNIAFLVPYKELVETVNEVISKRNSEFQANGIHIKLDRRSNIAECLADPQIDVIIARTASNTQPFPKLVKKSMKPIVQIPITTIDIISALTHSIDAYGSRDIAIISPAPSEKELLLLSSFFDCNLKQYCVSDKNHVKNVLIQAASEGFKSFIGGDIVRTYARGLGMDCSIIPVGVEAIMQALDEASHIANVITQELVNNGILHTVVSKLHDGLLYVSTNGIIRLANEASAVLLKRPTDSLIGASLLSVSASLEKILQTCLSTGESSYSNIVRYDVDRLMVNCISNSEDSIVSGVVITLQNILSIQDDEAQIRKKLSSKGLYAKYTFDDILHCSDNISHLISVAKKYALTSSNIMITGETGTGKELIAQSIHNYSARKNGPFVAVNCAAIPENLLESELFGYEEGAFTGGKRGGKIGLFELAHNGTIFLDEIAELPLELQSKLLRVLQEMEVRRIGAESVRKINTRVIAATNKNLFSMVESGKFRRDLYYRLVVLKIIIPPLRDRKDDILMLFRFFISTFTSENLNPLPDITDDAEKLIISHNFPGNIRELRNLAERISIICSDKHIIEYNDVVFALSDDFSRNDNSLLVESVKISEQDEVKNIIDALVRNNYSKAKTAEELGINRSTLWRKIKQYNICT